jgi:hypothetical protein
MAKKNEMQISKGRFLADAKSIIVDIAGNPIVIHPREYKKGSFGWHTAGKVMLDVGGKLLKVQVGIVLTVVGSGWAAEEVERRIEKQKKEDKDA